MPHKHHRKPSPWPKILVIGGLALLVLAVWSFKPKSQPAAPAAGESQLAEVLLDQALAEKRPTLAFFHSNNCYQCQVMMETVTQAERELENLPRQNP